MTPERWRQVTEVFHGALALDVPARAAYLDRVCAGDGGLREEVAAMLAAHQAPAGFGDRALDGARRLDTGAVVGAYRIDRLIGSGGMAEVYRARDTRLGRDVAIKVLPEAFASDPERSARFEREARLLAALNHPHIAHIYDVEKAPGTFALVMELVDGPTLADRIAHGPIPVDEALAIARQIAEALEAAHEQGIIHRDLKPANVKVRPDGTVKVLDFGLAKALEPVDWNATASPTVTSPAVMTGVGVLLGTAAYMSPEQARGKAVDKRSDIWAFGCVLYEMLVGRRAFDGEDVTEGLALIFTKEPDWSLLPSATPAAIRALLKGCLEKKSRERVADISTALFVLKEHVHLASSAAVTPNASSPRVPLWRRVAPAAGAALLIGSAATSLTWMATRPDPPRVVRTELSTSGSTALTLMGTVRDVAITQDGSRIVYRGANSQFLVRRLDQLTLTSLTGLGLAHSPFLSPDGQWVGFFDLNGLLKKVAITGGPPVTVATVKNGNAYRGGTWGENDTIIFATDDVGETGLLQVPAAGGEPSVLTKPDSGGVRTEHYWPEVLPGGRGVLFTIQPVGGFEPQIAVLDLRTNTQTVLVRGGSHAFYVPTGHLVYGAGGTLYAVAFDLARLAVIGTPVPILERVATTTTGAVEAALGANGTLVYLGGSVGVGIAQRSLVWVDRQGREELLPAPPGSYRGPRLSPDGTRVAVGRDDGENDLWLYDLARATLTRLTFDPSGDTTPIWTPDGRRLVFVSTRGARSQNVYIQAADGTGSALRLTESPNVQAVTDITADSARVLVSENRRDLGLLTLPPALLGSPVLPATTAGAVSKVEPLIATRFEERWGVVSPGGRWMAYESNSSGRFEIYVRPFPAVGDAQWQVSTAGGTQALWARDGRELFFVAPDGSLMAVPVDVRNAAWQAGTPSKLFNGPYFRGTANQVGRHYDVTADGQRFLMIKESGDAAAASQNLILVQNWTEELKRLVPVD